MKSIYSKSSHNCYSPSPQPSPLEGEGVATTAERDLWDGLSTIQQFNNSTLLGPRIRRRFYWFIAGLCILLSAGLGRGEEIKDVKPPMDFPPDYPFWIVLAFIILAVSLSALVRLLRKRRRKPLKPAVSRPAWELAYQRLEQLRQDNLPAHGQVKEYYSRLSDICRRYLEDRFDLRAPEMTTPEFLLAIRTDAALTPGQKEVLKEFLNNCDMVKFARFTAGEEEMAESLGLIQKLIDETKGPAAAEERPAA